MNKIILPTILIATAIAAGAMVFAPIDEAQAVHTTVQNSQMNEGGALAAAQLSTDLSGTTITVDSTADFVVGCIVSNNVAGASTFTYGDGTFTSGALDIAADSSFAFTHAMDDPDTFTLSAGGDVDGYCTGKTTTAGAITYGP